MFVCALLFLLVAACATAPSPPGPPPAEADHAEQLYRQGHFDKSADAFLELAQQTRGDESAHYRLRAAEALGQLGDLDGAEHALDGVKRRRLHGDDTVRLDLLDAEIALKHGDAARAQGLLIMRDTALPVPLRERVLELRARADLAAGDAFSSAHERAVLDAEVGGPDRARNRQKLTDALATLDANTLKTRSAELAPTDPLLPWVEQALRNKGQSLASATPHPTHPVGTTQPGAPVPEGYQANKQVALLLPLGPSLVGVSQSIRDGFLSEHFADATGVRPVVRIYDSGASPADAIAAYNKAVAEGADRVIGPLQRESVGALFHLKLNVPILALNHPDTGEVPPAGSVEFGLLPETEGTQVAEHMQERGITHAAILIADAEWAARAAHAFQTQFEAGGGTVVGESKLIDKSFNYSTYIAQATANLGADGNSGVFLSMRPQQARILMPQLRIAKITAAVFATSHVYAGDTDPALDRDLDGVEFCDSPWLFGPVAGRPDRNLVMAQLASANGVGARLFAFGMDAYALLPYMDWLLSHPDAYLAGATGDLSADSFGRIHRLMSWARFQNGIAVPVEGALNTQPAQP